MEKCMQKYVLTQQTLASRDDADYSTLFTVDFMRMRKKEDGVRPKLALARIQIDLNDEFDEIPDHEWPG